MQIFLLVRLSEILHVSTFSISVIFRIIHSSVQVTMTRDIIKGLPSTMNDGYQLNMTSIIRDASRIYSDSEIIYPDGQGGWSSYTYAESYQRICKIGISLNELGVLPGEIIGVACWNTREFFELYWSIPALGAVLLQINVRLSPRQIAYIVEHSRVDWMIIEESFVHLIDELNKVAPNIKGWIIISENNHGIVKPANIITHSFGDLLNQAREYIDWPVVSESSSYSACYTSGTTGQPKGIFYSHRSVYLQTLYLVAMHGISLDDNILLITPMFHVNCWGLPQAGVFAGSKIVLSGRYGLDSIKPQIELMRAENITFMSGVPTLLQAIELEIRSDNSDFDFSNLRILCGGGEPNPVVVQYIEERTGAKIIHAFGSTESSALIAINHVKPRLRTGLNKANKQALKQKQGLPMVGMDLVISELSGSELSEDLLTVGELQVRAPWVATHYYCPDGVTKHEGFDDSGFWKSGDIVSLDINGYIKVLDRSKDMIKSGGEWISSIDMETAIAKIPGVKTVAVIGVSHPKWQERPLAIVIPDEGSILTLEMINKRLRESGFQRWQELDAVEFVGKIDLTGVGKVDKLALRAHYQDYFEKNTS